MFVRSMKTMKRWPAPGIGNGSLYAPYSNALDGGFNCHRLAIIPYHVSVSKQIWYNFPSSYKLVSSSCGAKPCRRQDDLDSVWPKEDLHGKCV